MADRIVLNTISYHGHGAIENIVPELTARGYKKAFVCSDPDLIKFGVTKKVTDLLDAANFAYAVYSEIKPNPTIANVQDGVAAFKAAEADCIVTIGGGSSSDQCFEFGGLFHYSVYLLYTIHKKRHDLREWIIISSYSDPTEGFTRRLTPILWN